MPFKHVVTATIENALNRLIQDDERLVRRLLLLKGKTIQLHLKEWDLKITFIFSHQIDVLGHYEGELDGYLSLSLTVLPKLKPPINITQLIKEERLVLEGDAQLVQQFFQLIIESKPDIEEWLSRFTGDAIAHSLVQKSQHARDVLKRQVTKQQQYSAQILTEEWRLLPSPLELAYFCEQVTETKAHMAQLNKRIEQLLEQI